MKILAVVVLLSAVSVACGQLEEGEWKDGFWQGPLALPPGYKKNGAPLPVKDTATVAAAKAAHLAAYKAISVRNSIAHGSHLPSTSWTHSPLLYSAYTWGYTPFYHYEPIWL